MEKSRRRKSYEFSNYVKETALAKAEYKCEECGGYYRDWKHLEAHHVLPIYIGRMVPELSSVIISSLANCKILCSDCHKETHKKKKDHKDYIEEIYNLLSIDTRPMFV